MDGLTAVLFERDELRLMVRSVPARVCPSCGEAYVHEDVAVRLLQEAKKISAAGSLREVIDYNELLCS